MVRGRGRGSACRAAAALPPPPCPRPPAHCTSPPPLTTWSADPAAASSAAARSTAQPLTQPGRVEPAARGAAVKYPPDRSRTTAQAARTSATSGAHAVDGDLGRGRAATRRCPPGTARTRGPPSAASGRGLQRPAVAAEPGTSNDTTVPITGSACRTRTSHGRRSARHRCPGALQRLNVAAAGVGGAGDGVDPRALRGQRLADQLGERELADLRVVLGGCGCSRTFTLTILVVATTTWTWTGP